MYKTSDLYLASYLAAKGHVLKDIEKKDKTIFVFTEKTDLKTDILEYFNGNGSVEPLNFVHKIRDMKTLTAIK